MDEKQKSKQSIEFGLVANSSMDMTCGLRFRHTSNLNPVNQPSTHFDGLSCLWDSSGSFLQDLVLEARLGRNEIAGVDLGRWIGKLSTGGCRVDQGSGTGDDSGGSGGADKGSSIGGR